MRISSFNSVFDGNGHTLSNFTYNKTTEDHVGLLGYVGISGEIQNLGLVNINVKGNIAVGGFVGENTGTISNCYCSGIVSGVNIVGGLVGQHNNGTITNCS